MRWYNALLQEMPGCDGTNPLATKVKLADLKHNSDLARLEYVDEKALARVEKYKRAIVYLESVASQAT